MKTNPLLRGLLGLIVTVALVSCDDHRIPAVTPGSPTDNLRIKSITQQVASTGGRVSSTQRISLFSYDLQGRLSEILTFQEPDSTVAPVEHSVYSYDSQNRLTELRRVIRRTGTDPTPEETYTFTYNLASQVSELNYINNSMSDINKWKVTYQYTPGNQLSTSTRNFTWYPVAHTEVLEYTFTGKNVTRIFATITNSRAPASSLTGTMTTNFTFDTYKNPFYGVYVIPAPYAGLSNPLSGVFHYYTYYGGFDNVFNISENNVLSDGTNTYAYTYNAANLPITRTTTFESNVTETLQYEYERY